jgi:hypothetical protein
MTSAMGSRRTWSVVETGFSVQLPAGGFLSTL